MALGFFIVLILEKIVVNCREMGGAQEERAPLIPENRNGHRHGQGLHSDLEGSGHHVHVDFQAHSSFRSFMLFLSLSLHSVFEGLAIGLQNTDSKVRRVRVFPLLGPLENILYFCCFLSALKKNKIKKSLQSSLFSVSFCPSIYSPLMAK